MVTGLPMISSAVYPKRRSALLFQLVMMPSRFLLMMASSEGVDDSAEEAAVAVGPFGLGGIADNLGCANDIALGVPHGRNGEGDIEQRAVLFPADGFEMIDALAFFQIGRLSQALH